MDEIKSSIIRAKECFEKKQYENLIQILESIIQKNRNLLDEEESKTDLGEMYLLFAKSFLALNKLDESLKHANDCLHLAKNCKFFSLQAKTLRILGSIYSQKGNHLKSLELLRKSLQLEQKIGDKIGEAYALFELGIEEADGEELNESIEHLKHAVKIFKNLDREKDAQTVQKELTIILEEMDEDKWLEEKIPKKFREKKGMKL